MILLWLIEGLFQLVWAVLKFIFCEFILAELLGELFRAVGRFILRLLRPHLPQVHNAEPSVV